MSQAAIIGVVVLMMMCSSSSSAMLMMGGDEEKTTTPTGPGPTPPTDPCAGLTDSSPASSVSVACLRKHLKDEGCTDKGTVWPGDDYAGWWRQDSGAGNYGVVKSDIHAWATMTDPTHVDGCGGATPCKGLTDSSPASAIPVSCLRKILTDEGCTDKGTVWPQDGYNGWWRQDSGAGNYGVVKNDIHAWATMTDAERVAGCGRAA